MSLNLFDTTQLVAASPEEGALLSALLATRAPTPALLDQIERFTHPNGCAVLQFQRGAYYGRARDYERAKTVFADCIRAHPHFGPAYLSLAMLYLNGMTPLTPTTATATTAIATTAIATPPTPPEFDAVVRDLLRIYGTPLTTLSDPVRRLRPEIDLGILLLISGMLVDTRRLDDAERIVAPVYARMRGAPVRSAGALITWTSVAFRMGQIECFRNMEAAFRIFAELVAHDPRALGVETPAHAAELARVRADVFRSIVVVANYTQTPYTLPNGGSVPDLIANMYAPHVANARLRDTQVPLTRKPAAETRLRVGFITSDFNRNAISLFASVPLQYLDATAFDVFCYYTNTSRDWATDWLEHTLVAPRHAAQRWFNVGGYDPGLLEMLIKSHALDVLIDLNAHAFNGKVEVLVARPARVVLHWLGYPNHTYLPAIYDGFITDGCANPVRAELLGAAAAPAGRERTLRMPRTFLCFQPFAGHPPPDLVADAPHDRVVVGIFNKTSKHHPALIAVWRRLIARFPFVVFHFKLNVMETSTTLDRDLPPDQVRITPFAEDLMDYYRLFNGADLVPDTYPYSGTTTTACALAMGLVPHTIYDRKHHAGNGTAAMLLNLGGAEDYITADLAGYEAAVAAHIVALRAAKSTAAGRAALLADRHAVRARFGALMEPRRWTREFETLLRDVAETLGPAATTEDAQQ
jgi:predicted O-linked N-acetylglucosamine transferase (SPINDLY family)